MNMEIADVINDVRTLCTNVNETVLYSLSAL